MTAARRSQWKVDISYRELSEQYYGPPPWRSYELNTYGNTKEQLEHEAAISEIDQDGGEVNTYGLEEASEKLQEEVKCIIKEELCKASTMDALGLP